MNKRQGISVLAEWLPGLQEGIFLGQLFNEISRITINAVIIFAI
jgi:hypothetical protein